MEDGHWMRRTEAARLLACSVSLVVWFERHGRLKARRDDRGVVTYARSEVAELARKRAARGTPTRRGDRDVLRESVNGELAAKAFELFALNRSLVEVVSATHLPPERVRALYEEFQTPLGMPSPSEVARVRENLERLSSDEPRTGAKVVHAFGRRSR